MSWRLVRGRMVWSPDGWAGRPSRSCHMKDMAQAARMSECPRVRPFSSIRSIAEARSPLHVVDALLSVCRRLFLALAAPWPPKSPGLWLPDVHRNAVDSDPSTLACTHIPSFPISQVSVVVLTWLDVTDGAYAGMFMQWHSSIRHVVLCCNPRKHTSTLG